MAFTPVADNEKVNPGSLRTPITIKRLVAGKDEDNRPIKELKAIYSCKAKITSYKGKQDLEAQGKVYIDEKSVIIRVPRKIQILDTDYVSLKNIDYNITSIVDIGERGRFYELKVRYAK